MLHLLQGDITPCLPRALAVLTESLDGMAVGVVVILEVRAAGFDQFQKRTHLIQQILGDLWEWRKAGI